MKMNMNWGSWIVVCFVIFAFGTFVMVYISLSTNVDLVTEDYYEKELKYQNHIELVKNTNALEHNVELVLTDTSVNIAFPKIGGIDTFSGTIQFFRPSDKREDVERKIKIDSAFTQSFSKNIFAQGLWKAKILWNAGSFQYYSEVPFIIQ